MPQTNDNFRPVATIGEMATIGGFGRSRETRMPVEPELVQQTMAERSSVSATCRAAAAMASAPVASGSVLRTCSDGRYIASLLSTSSAMRFIVATASTGYWPDADSADSMMASAPSKMAVATSETSARVGTGLAIMDSSIWVATTTGLPARRQARVISFCTPGTFSRGDLGVEMPLEKVPGVQKEMTRACRRAGKPVVVATQMLESMISSPVPTRAEVSDVATAIFDGADAIMLSAESASGQYPVESVTTMNRIAEEVEDDAAYLPSLHVLHTEPEATGADAIAAAARQVAETLDLAAIVCWTSSGSTGMRVSRERPNCPIVAISPSEMAGRKLSAVWGIHCVIDEDAHDQDDMVERACRIAFQERFAKAGQRIIVVAGVPLGTPGATNFMRIAYVGEDKAGE